MNKCEVPEPSSPVVSAPVYFSDPEDRGHDLLGSPHGSSASLR